MKNTGNNTAIKCNILSKTSATKYVALYCKFLFNVLANIFVDSFAEFQYQSVNYEFVRQL
ncbi:hypothetical protein BpHYR1_036953 [Brachionus plicatilis]|uniref:Uncharacterized protein n=1 Tax=Brachionus plicatilis TaxID=10195 RepID=A0A3M7S8X8_BRAPC|nr:hypothetical protein BpHYR1_036953 [Brachionus plicatilis]